MKAVVQRVKNASVTVENTVYSSISTGLLVLFCVEKEDEADKLDWFAKKLASLRIFEDENGKMNLSVSEIQGEILIVSQFTLAADCKKGTRPSFDNAELPQRAEKMYEDLIVLLRNKGLCVKTGVFGAMMEVDLSNDGPVTIILDR